MDTDVELPPNGKPYNLLTVAELERFEFYREHGGKMGINVSLKALPTEHAGIQLVVVVKSIKTALTANREDITAALVELNSSWADEDYKERLNAVEGNKLVDLYLVKPMKVETQETAEFSHLYQANNIPVDLDKSSITKKPKVNYVATENPNLSGSQFIPAPRTLMDRIKILFGFY